MNFNALIARLVATFQKPMVQGTLWMMMARVFRIGIQAGYFVLVARALGVEQYGAFVGVTALVGLLNPFCGLGSEHILIKNVSRNHAVFPQYFGNAMFMALTTSVLLTGLIFAVSQLILPSSVAPLVVLLISISDLFFLRMLDMISKGFLAVDLVGRTAQIQIMLSLKNLLAALTLVVFFPQATVLNWAILYCVSTMLAAVVAFILICRIVAGPKLALARLPGETVEGVYFSISMLAQSVNHNVDKTMLTRLGTLQATGVYAAAYRLVDVAFTPVLSLMSAAYAKFFKQGERGITGSVALARRLVPIAALYGLAAAVALLIGAPLVPFILGSDYAESVGALRWLAPLLVLQSVQFFAADTLTGAGFQGFRSGLQVVAASFNFLLNLWLIPAFSWQGAAWSSLASDGLLTVSLMVLVYTLYKRQTSEQAG
ncbi:MAG: oligosaccharide flippase family protein [Kaiparowitsia implicata GSE-PSE-MK54-09C]|jgi:O-antigen/teichoic acid export membrane protein|nr:oligosaccharide flippase family protein [Kaiparowitsia implicata GSE-PSE-MK54-09C]